MLEILGKGAIIPLFLYGIPVWEEALNVKRNQEKFKRIQRIINIKMAKCFRTISYEASCMLAGEIPIILKAKELVSLYNFARDGKHGGKVYDAPYNYKRWPHPAMKLLGEDIQNANPKIVVYTDGSKTSSGVGCAAIVNKNNHTTQLSIKLNHSCTLYQAQQLAVLKALEEINKISLQYDIVRIYVKNESIKSALINNKDHGYIIRKIREQLKLLSENKVVAQIRTPIHYEQETSVQ